MFGGKRGRLASRRTPSQPLGWWGCFDTGGTDGTEVGVLGYRRVWCTSQNIWHHEDETFCGYIEATSQDISQEVEA